MMSSTYAVSTTGLCLHASAVIGGVGQQTGAATLSAGACLPAVLSQFEMPSITKLGNKQTQNQAKVVMPFVSGHSNVHVYFVLDGHAWRPTASSYAKPYTCLQRA